LFFEDCCGGHHTFLFEPQICSGTSSFNPASYSLTCEQRAPFITFEVLTNDTPLFQELRNPGVFSQLTRTDGLDFRTRSEDRDSVPGNKSFVRLNSANSILNFSNIAYQAWGGITIAIRPTTMPVKETLVNFVTGSLYLSIIATPISGSVVGISIEHNFSGNRVTTVNTPIQMLLTQWNLLYVLNKGNGLDILCGSFDELVSSRGRGMSNTQIRSSSIIYPPNGISIPGINRMPAGYNNSACNICIGTRGMMNIPGMYSTPSFNYDIAWVHFFEQIPNEDDILRESKVDWIYTQFPNAPNTFKRLEM
jgi:hypothetical protein